MTRLFVNVDDIRMERYGVEKVIQDLSGDEEREVCNLTFAEACARDSWDGVDYLVVDLSQAVDDDPWANEYPAIDVIKHVQRTAAGRGPHVVVVTGDKGVYENPVIKRLLFELGVRVLVHREQLDVHAEQILAAGGPQWDQLAMKGDVAHPAPGVDEHTNLRTVVEMVREHDLHRKPLEGGVGHGIRLAIQKAGKLKAVLANGTGKRSGAPHQRHLADLDRRATRIPRRGETRN